MKILLTVKHKIILLLISAVCSMALITYLIILPTAKEIREINQKIYSEKENLEAKFQEGQYLTKIIEDLKTIEPQLEKIKSVFVLRGEEVKFITRLEKISDKYRLDAVFPSPEEEKISDNGLQGLKIEIQILGGYRETLAFLAELESLDYFIDISEVRMSSSGDKTGKVKSSLKGLIYISDPNENKKI